MLMVVYSPKTSNTQALNSACSQKKIVFNCLNPPEELVGKYGSVIMRPANHPVIHQMFHFSIRLCRGMQTMTMETSELQTFRIDFTNILRSASCAKDRGSKGPNRLALKDS